ncbi:hypothetical protein D3C86_1669630 [compost metagenome]
MLVGALVGFQLASDNLEILCVHVLDKQRRVPWVVSRDEAEHDGLDVQLILLTKQVGVGHDLLDVVPAR